MTGIPNTAIDSDDLADAAAAIVEAYHAENRPASFVVRQRSLRISADFSTMLNRAMVRLAVAPHGSPSMGVTQDITTHVVERDAPTVLVAILTSVRRLDAVAVETIRACAPALRDTDWPS